MAHFNANDFNYVKSFIENNYSEKLNNKYTLFSNNYENNTTPLEIIDSDGYKFSSNFGSVLCGYKMNAHPRKIYKNNKYTIFNMRHYIESNNINCELLSNEYIGAKNHLIFKCTCGNEFATTWNEFKVGKQQCNSCGRLVTSKLFKLDESEVAEYFANYDCKLLSSYKGMKDIPYALA